MHNNVINSLNTTHRYRHEHGKTCIDLHIQSIQQIFDARDPAPFREKDLDEDLVRYLLLSSREINYKDPIQVVFTIPHDLQIDEETIRNAIHSFFEFEIDAAYNERSLLFRQGRFALLLGMIFVLLCSSLVYLASQKLDGFAGVTVRESLTIMGWVALWKPINLFLYEWWPIRDRMRIYAKLANVPVVFRRQK